MRNEEHNRELTGHPEVPKPRGTSEMRHHATRFLLRLSLATFEIFAFGGLIAALPAGAQTACPPTINQCGCTISSSGSYKIGLAINSAQGLTVNNACIEVAASFVILDAGKKTVTGPGGAAPTGTGIWVHRGFHSIVLEGRGATISGFDVGLLILGSQVVADSFIANNNGTAGIELFNADSVELTNATAENNLNYGIWLKRTSLSNITNSKAESNGNVGLYVGCADIGPTNSGCGGTFTSRSNYIFTGNIMGNTNYGVALDIGAKSTIVTNQTLGGGTHNSKDDLFDASSNCGTDKWFANDSTATNNQAGGCIK